MVNIVQTSKAFEALEPVWRALEASDNVRIFQTFNWCRTAWLASLEKDSHNKLWIIHWRGAEDNVILPTYIDKKGVLRFIYDTDSDTCDALYKRGCNHNLAYYEIAKAIMAEHIIKGVWLQKMRGTSEALNYLGVMLRGGLAYKDNAFSWIDVAAGDDFIASQKHMKSKDRADLKNLLRRSDKYALKIVSSTAGDKFPESELFSLRDAMRKCGKRDSVYFSDDSIWFVKELYDKGVCDVAILTEGAKVSAANVLLKKDNRILSWVFLYNDPHASTALYIKYFCETKASHGYVFDFGVGVYSYKIGTFRPKISATYSFRWSNSHMAFVRNSLACSVRFLKDYVKSFRK